MSQVNVTMTPNGRVVIPASMRAELGWQTGGKLVARLADGAVILEPVDAAIRRAQALVRRYVPENAGLVEELMLERRAAAKRE